jgi:aryl-phospho-beta-D-glucosidase BglC (GH1 family)
MSKPGTTNCCRIWSYSDTGKIEKCLSILASICAITVSSVAFADDARPSMAFNGSGKLLLCLNVLQPFGYGISSGQRGAATYDGDPFENGGRDREVMPDERLQYIHSVGFDCVRMAIDVAALMASPNDAALDRLVEQVANGVARRVKIGLKVIADVHPLPGGTHPVSGFADVDMIDGPSGPKFRRLLQVVSRLAVAIGTRSRPSDVALELFNEPPPPNAFSRRAPWNKQIETYWGEIRRVLPDHTLIVAGMGFAEIDGTITGSLGSGLTNLRPERYDANTGFAFHPYESPLFTQQGDPGFYSHVHGLSFPAADHPGGQKRAESDFIADVNSDAKLSLEKKRTLVTDFIQTARHSYSFARYWREFGSREALAARLAVLTFWADSHGLDRRQIMNTEFGVNRNQTSCENRAPSQSANAFIKATREISEMAGIGAFTIHEMQGSCFAISRGTPPFSFDAEILSALGLK